MGYDQRGEQVVVIRPVAEKGGLAFKRVLPQAARISELLKKTESIIASFGYKDFSDKELFTNVSYVLRKPGKMLRPALVLLGAELSDSDTDDLLEMAAAAELLHAASLVHDDIIDGDTVRRGAPSLHIKYGQEAAILAGDALIAKAVSIAARYGPRVVKRVAEASLDMCAGELLDYTMRREGKTPSVREYLRIARLKSGVFMGTCASIAATYKRNSRKAAELYGFGLSLGMAFQIRDDIIEFADAGERKRNGGGAGADSPNLVRVFAGQFGISEGDALRKSVGLNNYFADRALQFVREEKRKDELATYIDFVRVQNR